MSEGTASERAVLEAVRQTVQGIGADTVFGEPITRGETTIIPVARISGGGGGGGGGGPVPESHGRGGGSGSGLKVGAEPAGVFVIRNEQVHWRPSLDLNKVILGAQLVAVVALLVLRAARRNQGMRDRMPRPNERLRPVLLRRP
ncbi:MAG TPA: spore germination protein GerW family protein [Micromonospora sp.]|nr:spore germination protein GerW family protein [Micromonospora sp.]